MKTIIVCLIKALTIAFCLWMVTACKSTDFTDDTIVGTPDINVGSYEKMTIAGVGKGLVTGRIYDEIVKNSNIITDFKRLGIKWVRIEFEEYINLPVGISAESAEVRENIYKFRSAIQLFHDNGIKVLGVIALNSLTNKEVPLNNEKIALYTKSVEWHLNTYSIDAIEIWNEPYGFGFSPKENLKWYGKTLIDVYDKLKPKYPTILFIGPATANAEAGEWIGRHDWQKPDLIEGENSIFNSKDMRDWRTVHNGKLPLDILSFHSYGSGTANPLGDFYFGRNFKTFYQEIANYKDLDGRSILGNNPVWITEFGWTSNNKPGTGVSENTQKDNYIAIMNEFESFPNIENVFLYDYKDDENVAGSEGNACGLVKNSSNKYAQKQIYYSFFSRCTGVGLILNDLRSTPVNEVVQKYIELGGSEILGTPVFSDLNKNTKGYLYSLPFGLYVQHYLKNQSFPIAITYDKATGKSYFIPEVFYTYYFSQYEVLKKPKGDAISENGVLIQNFEGGSLKCMNNTLYLTK
jgi:hypothetical protein